MKDLDKLWVGVVEDNKDPKKLGRVRVRVQGLFGDIPVEDIPWSSPIKSLSSRSFELPAIGKIVSVIFPNDMIYESYYMFADNYNVNLKKKLDDLKDDEYVNFVAVLFDHRTKIYSDDTNLTMDYKYNRITIDNNDINLELKDNGQKINLGALKSDQQAVLGNHWFDWMDEFVEALLKPTSLICGAPGAPVLKPDIDRLMVKYEKLKETFLSKNVYIVDNKKVEKLDMKYNSPIMDDGLKLNKKSVVKEGSLGDDLRNKIIDQKNKNLEEIKKSIPTDVFVEEESSDNPEKFEQDQGGVDVYKIIENDTEKEITKQEYDKIKSDEMKFSNLESYEIVDEQSDADEIAYGFQVELIEENQSSNPDEISYDYDPNREFVYTAPNGNSYIDVSKELNYSNRNYVYTGKTISLRCSDIPSNVGDSYNLSPHYTIYDLTKGPIVSHYDLRSQCELSKQQIACNLKALAINCLEPILAKYPKMRINSAFRHHKIFEKVSQHDLGEAADISFGNPKLNYDIAQWIKSNVPYYQLILEYSGSGGWIHVSYKNGIRKSDRTQFGTYLVSNNPQYQWGTLIKYA